MEPSTSAPRGSAGLGTLTGSGRDARGLWFQALLLAALLTSLLVLVVLLVTVVTKGWPVISERPLEFLTSGTSRKAAEAGVWQGIKGSFLIALFVMLFAVPVGVGAAIYLEEYAADTRLTRLITVNIRNLAGVPSIVYGLLGLTVFVEMFEGLTGGRSVISGGLILAVLVLPIVIITSSEALRAVPTALREAGFGVGASRWEVIRHHVLPYAMPGILTGTVLSVARALGEAAPLILVGAKTGFFATANDAGIVEQVQGPFTALPNVTYAWARLPGDDAAQVAGATIVVMLLVVLTANAGAILLRNKFDKARHG